MRVLRIVPGVVLLLAVGVVAVSAWGALVANHPAYPVALILAALLGVVLVLSGVLTHSRPSGGAVSLILRVAAAAAGVGLAAVLVWYRPFEASSAALDATNSDATVTVTQDRSVITFTPAQQSGAGLVLYPGARVDPRAYSVLAREIARQGHPVIVPKCPFDTALLCINAASDWVADGGSWAVGGHSLGGVAASQYAGSGDPEVAGLVLWASWPANDLSAEALEVASIYGSQDGLATPEQVLAGASDLPPATTFVEVAGAVHAYFGDYGEQPGDGEPTTSRAEAQAEIVAATVALLDRLGKESATDGER